MKIEDRIGSLDVLAQDFLEIIGPNVRAGGLDDLTNRHLKLLNRRVIDNALSDRPIESSDVGVPPGMSDRVPSPLLQCDLAAIRNHVCCFPGVRPKTEN